MRKIFIFICIVFLTLSAEAQRVASFFYVMPEELIPQLETNRRKDIIDLYKHDKKGGVTNSLGGKSDVIELSENYLEVGMSASSTLQIKLLPWQQKDTTGTIITVIRTVCAPACNSTIEFYDTNWTRLKTEDFISLPTDKMMFKSESADSVSVKKALQLIDISLMRYDLAPRNDDLQFTTTIGDYMPEEYYKQIKPLLRESPLLYKWNGKCFVIKEK